MTWVARFGVPSVLTLDRGTQFTSSVWTRVCRSLGISPPTTTRFHPQSNGMIKRFHRSLKTALRACLAGSDWFLQLPLVLLGLPVCSQGGYRVLCLRGCVWFSSYCSWMLVSFCPLSSSSCFSCSARSSSPSPVSYQVCFHESGCLCPSSGSALL